MVIAFHEKVWRTKRCHNSHQNDTRQNGIIDKKTLMLHALFAAMIRFVIYLSIIVLSVIMLSIVILIVVMLKEVLLSVAMPSM